MSLKMPMIFKSTMRFWKTVAQELMNKQHERKKMIPYEGTDERLK